MLFASVCTVVAAFSSSRQRIFGEALSSSMSGVVNVSWDGRNGVLHLRRGPKRGLTDSLSAPGQCCGRVGMKVAILVCSASSSVMLANSIRENYTNMRD